MLSLVAEERVPEILEDLRPGLLSVRHANGVSLFCWPVKWNWHSGSAVNSTVLLTVESTLRYALDH